MINHDGPDLDLPAARDQLAEAVQYFEIANVIMPWLDDWASAHEVASSLAEVQMIPVRQLPGRYSPLTAVNSCQRPSRRLAEASWLTKRD